MQNLFPTTKSFESAFNEYYPRLVAFVYKQTQNREQSEDIVQELFAHIYEKRREIKINQSFKAYLFRAAFNRCISFQRTQLTKDKYEISLSAEEPWDFRDLLIEEEFEHKVFLEIKKLPKKCKEIFILNRFEDFSNDEIANKLNISKRTVETQISKALKILRASLNPQTFYLFFF